MGGETNGEDKYFIGGAIVILCMVLAITAALYAVRDLKQSEIPICNMKIVSKKTIPIDNYNLSCQKMLFIIENNIDISGDYIKQEIRRETESSSDCISGSIFEKQTYHYTREDLAEYYLDKCID